MKVSSIGEENFAEVKNMLEEAGINSILQGNLFGFGYGITKIVTNSGWQNPENLYVRTLTGFRAWLCWLFDKDFEVEERKRGR